MTNHARYSAILDETFTKIRDLSETKGAEYAGDIDRLANFRRNGERLGLPMESVWAVYATKHWDAIMQYVMDLNTGKARKRSEPLAGRVDDMITYLILFKLMLEESAGPTLSDEEYRAMLVRAGTPRG